MSLTGYLQYFVTSDVIFAFFVEDVNVTVLTVNLICVCICGYDCFLEINFRIFCTVNFVPLLMGAWLYLTQAFFSV